MFSESKKISLLAFFKLKEFLVCLIKLFFNARNDFELKTKDFF